MPDVIGIRFKNCGKIYDFEVNGLEVAKGDVVVVESELGLSMGSVVVGRRALAEGTKELKKVLRKATEDDLKQKSENKRVAEEAMAYCIERIMARGLPMKLISTEVTLDRKRFVFYFTADGRIDFRELVKDLAARFKTRIEMRQVGVRDASKIVGGLGICGRELCCKTFLTSFEPISIRMAKSQELVLNANKLSGVCGRLMCCLGYEYSEGEKAEDACREEELTTTVNEDEGAESVIVEEPSLPAKGDIAATPKEQGRRHSRHRRSHRPPAPEAAGQRGAREEPSPKPSESAGHGEAERSGREEMEHDKPAAVAAQKDGPGRRHRRRRRHERKARR
ncbi:MAG TPA: stage 0 sporulation family protein [Thermodesulfovibrionales bacterium]|nr:stage 0 sporulation family protein [Thermodesulfovibrionales bacterium]